MDIWQTAQPDRPGNTGWLGRWLDTFGGDPRHAVSFEPVLPPLLAGATQRRRRGPGDRARPAQRGADGDPGAFGAVGRRAGAAGPGRPRFADLVSVDALITQVQRRGDADTDDDADDGGGTGTGGGRTDLKAQLDLVARCVEANVATRVFSVSLGGFDLHAEEKRGSQESLLGGSTRR